MTDTQDKARKISRLRHNIGEDERDLSKIVRNASTFGMTPVREVAIANLKGKLKMERLALSRLIQS